MNIHTKRQHRRRANMKLKFGDGAVRKHCHKGGRMGRIRGRGTPGKHAPYLVALPNPPGPDAHNLGAPQ